MDAVLGLSVTPSAVGLVLVEGQDADGATVDRDAIEIPGRRSTPQQTSDEAAAAVLRTEALAATRGHRLHSIGVTWSDNADLEASLLLKSLSDCGFDNVVPIRLPEASEALAWGVAEVIGNDVTAVCVVESDTVIALVVHAREGAVQTAVNHAIDDDEALVRWLSAVFAKADWRPQALVMVGSGAGVDELMPQLEDALGVPVFAPAEAELALARGAALASTHIGELSLDETDVYTDDQAGRRRPAALTGPLAMLAAGAVTFVASVSVAISMQLAPDKGAPPAEPSPAAKSSSGVPAAAEPLPIATPAPAALPAPPPVEVAPPPAELPAEPPVVAVDTAPAPQAPPLPPAAPPEPVAAPVAGAPVLPPESMAPGLVPAQPTPVPERRGFLQRIKDRLNIGDDAGLQQAPAPVMPPPGPVLAPDPALAPPPPPA
ncbi:DUF7159 family protein [Mycobacterium sp. IDR2000157661]|uniref:DUF7159 family protein n=1 Tax=Mycobacterium sp. IDR2000157661 TaxID=2867005 RepID=UPI001EECBE51|nr:hypothetical protein [Mycobacterium sp. IDR2000157661]ULE32355.1 hypothetical protein K3G64_19825 [Mycobacterium sp. IDR2000157661]